MKKLTAILLAVALLASMTLSVSAATTTLTTTVPDATYTMNIPADQAIPYGAESSDIGTVTITNASGFAKGKNVYVKVEHDGLFKSETVASTIPYSIVGKGFRTTSTKEEMTITLDSGSYLVFLGLDSGSVNSYFDNTQTNIDYEEEQTLRILISSKDWGKALAGDYSTVITFTAVVANSTPTE